MKNKTTKYAIYGALIGDYYGSYWEFKIEKPKDLADALRLRPQTKYGGHYYTDDTFMTVAIAKAVLDCCKRDCLSSESLAESAIKYMREVGKSHPSSYGGSFGAWLRSEDTEPYYSFGNGAAMRVSPIGLSARTPKMCFYYAQAVTEVTHNHPYGIEGGVCVALLVYMAKNGYSKSQMKAFLKNEHPNYWKRIKRGMTLRSLHRDYQFNETCQDTVPQAIYCFLTSKSFSDCLARSLYIGGDSDTLAAISCSIAAPFYGDEQVKPFVMALPEPPEDLHRIIKVFSYKYL